MDPNGSQVIGDHGPSNPSLETVFALVEAAVQSEDTFENRNAAFHTSMPLAAPTEPALLFKQLALWRFLTWFGQHHPFDAPVFGILLVGSRIDTPVGADLVRRFVELSLMGLQAGSQLSRVIGIAFQDPPVGDDAAFNLVQPDLVTVLDRLADLAPANDVGVWFEGRWRRFFLLPAPSHPGKPGVRFAR